MTDIQDSSAENLQPDSKLIRLDKLLCAKFNLSFSQAQKLIRIGKVKVDGVKIKDAAKKFSADQAIDILAKLDPINLDKPKTARPIDQNILNELKQSIILRDEYLIALNKPAGLASQGGSKIKQSVDDYLPYLKFDAKEIPRMVHRLDRDTSGLLLLARDFRTAAMLALRFKERKIKKTYLALVSGRVAKKAGVISIPIRKKMIDGLEKMAPDQQEGKEAITKFKLIRHEKNRSLLELMPITGRTHQLRIHCKEIGHPIVGDFKYGPWDEEKKGSRLCLHAWKVEIQDYFGSQLLLTTPLPNFADRI